MISSGYKLACALALVVSACKADDKQTDDKPADDKQADDKQADHKRSVRALSGVSPDIVDIKPRCGGLDEPECPPPKEEDDPPPTPKRSLGHDNVCYVGEPGVDAPPGQELALYVASLHHRDNDPDLAIPGKDEIRQAVEKVKRVLNHPDDSIIVLGAAPCQGNAATGYLGSSAYQMAAELAVQGVQMRTVGDIGPIGAETALGLCNGGPGRTALILGANWAAEANGYEWYPPEIRSQEGQIYGVFLVRHKASGRKLQIVTGTVDHVSTSVGKRSVEIQHLLARGRELAQTYPTIVAGDFNFSSGEGDCPQDDPPQGGCTYGAEAIRQSMASNGARRLSFWNPCQVQIAGAYQTYEYDTGGVMHMVLFDQVGAAPLQQRSFVLDPDHVVSPLDQSASPIRLPTIRHVMLGARFQI